jgi:hypothetical protein
LIIRALLTTGATYQELSQAIMDSDSKSDRLCHSAVEDQAEEIAAKFLILKVARL